MAVFILRVTLRRFMADSKPEEKWSARARLAEAARLARYVPKTFRLVWSSGRGTAFGLLATMLAQATLPAGIAWTGKLIVDGVVRAARTGLQADRERVITLVLVELALMAASTGLGRLSSLVRELLRTHLGNLVNVRILEKAISLELRHFDDASVYDKMQNARREASSRPYSLVVGLLGAAQSTVTLATYVVLLARLSGWSVVVIVVASVPAFIAETSLARRAFRISSWRAPEARRMNYLEYILTRDTHVKEAKLFGLGALVVGRYKALFAKFYVEDRALAVRRAVLGSLLSLLSLAAFYGAYVWMAWRAALGAISLGDLTLYLTVFRQGQSAVQSILSAVSGLYEDALFMSELFEYLDLKAVGEEPRVLPARAARPGVQRLELRNVSFRYAGAKKDVLSCVNLVVEPGEKVALVGDNGAGKSTLIKLLLRLYEPTGGEILYGGVDVRDMDPAELRARLGVVFQDFVRYQFTLAENIGLGSVPALADRARIEESARRGGADEVAKGLPLGYETMLGGWFEAGQELSVGQWQKVAIARGFMRDAELLILDEPTASLDAEAEHDLFTRLAALASGRSAILVSHRFSTVRMADRIAVLRDGAIIELGTHAELVAKAGRYARLYELQASGYR